MLEVSFPFWPARLLAVEGVRQKHRSLCHSQCQRRQVRGQCRLRQCKSNSLTGIRTDHIHKNIHYISRVCAGSSAHALIILQKRHYSSLGSCLNMDAKRCNEYDNSYEYYYSLNKLIVDKRDAGGDQKLKISLVLPKHG